MNIIDELNSTCEKFIWQQVQAQAGKKILHSDKERKMSLICARDRIVSSKRDQFVKNIDLERRAYHLQFCLLLLLLLLLQIVVLRERQGKTFRLELMCCERCFILSLEMSICKRWQIICRFSTRFVVDNGAIQSSQCISIILTIIEEEVCRLDG